MTVKEVQFIPEHTVSSAEINRWVFQEKVRMLYRNHTQSWVLSLLAVTIIAYLSVNSGFVTEGLSLWAALVAITVLRSINTLRFNRLLKRDEVINYHRAYQRFFIYSVLAGLGWCVGGIYIGADLEPLMQVYILIVLIGVGAAAIPLLGVFQNVLLAFQIPTTIPYLFFIAVKLEDQGVILIFMFGIYLLGVIYAIRRMDENLSTSLGLQYEKAVLASSLSESNQELQSANEILETLSLEDALTGLQNRRYFEMQLELEWKRQVMDKQPLALMVIDIDYFKLYNDYYGHPEGDQCLKSVADLLAKSVRRTGNVIARVGGEEFVSLLPATDSKQAYRLAQRTREKLAKANLIHATSPLGGVVTVSIGIAAVVPDKANSALGLFKAADKALYRAKAKGRNQIEVGEYEQI